MSPLLMARVSGVEWRTGDPDAFKNANRATLLMISTFCTWTGHRAGPQKLKPLDDDCDSERKVNKADT